MTASLRIAAWSLLLLLAAGPALSQAGGGRATLGGGAGTEGPTLSREQLRECLVERDELRKANAALAVEQKALEDDKANLGRAAAALQERQQTLDRTSADAVQAHAADAKAHDEQVVAWNSRLPAFNDRARALQKRGDEWKGACGDRRYREDDLLLLQGRGQVPAPPK